MNKTASLLSVAILMVCVPMAMAGDFHFGDNLICSDCHVMHYSQSHGYNADGTGIYTPLGTAGPYHYLLRNDVNDLCLTCHDGVTWAPDVLGPNTVRCDRAVGWDALRRDRSTAEVRPLRVDALARV